MGYDDFCRLDFEDFAAVYKAYMDQRDFDFKDRWNRTRTLATIVIQPHLSKNKKVTPEKLLPFPWDKKAAAPKKNERKMTKEEQRKRMEQLVEQLGDEMI